MKSEQLRVAVVQPYLTHYREPIYNALCCHSIPDPEYTMFSDVECNINIKTISFTKREIPPESGGLRWKLVRNRWCGKVLLWQSGIISLSRNNKHDVIIYAGCMYHISTWIGLLVAKMSGKRTLLWTHGFLRKENSVKGWIRKVFYKMADGMLLYGNRAKNILIEEGFSEESIYVVYNSLNYNKQRLVRESVSQDQLDRIKISLFPHRQLPVLVFIGRLTRQKKIEQLLEAMRIMKARRLRVNLLLIGDGPIASDLRCLASEYGLTDFVIFYGECYSEEEIGPLIMLADICVSPGEVGLTCMHALVYGTPVISHDNPEMQMPEWEAIEPGISGALFSENNVNSLAIAIEQHLETWHDNKTQRLRCSEIVDKYYNPKYQKKIINDAVLGIGAGSVESV